MASGFYVGNNSGLNLASSIAQGLSEGVNAYMGVKQYQNQLYQQDFVRKLEMAKLQMEYQKQIGESAINMGQLKMLTNMEKQGIDVPTSVKSRVFNNILDSAQSPQAQGFVNQGVGMMTQPSSTDYLAQLGIQTTLPDGAEMSTPATIKLAESINQQNALMNRAAISGQYGVERANATGANNLEKAKIYAGAGIQKAQIAAGASTQNAQTRAGAQMYSADKRAASSKNGANPAIQSNLKALQILTTARANVGKGLEMDPTRGAQIDAQINQVKAALRAQGVNVDAGAPAAPLTPNPQPTADMAPVPNAQPTQPPPASAPQEFNPGQKYQLNDQFTSGGRLYQVVGFDANGAPNVKALK